MKSFYGFFALILIVAGSSSCTSKTDSDEVIIRGHVTLPSGAQDGVLIVGASTKSFAEIVQDPIGSVIKTVATKDLTSYEMKIPRKLLNGSRELQIFGFVDQDFDATKLPKISKGDLVGFALSGIRPGITISEKDRDPVYADLAIDRSAKGREVDLTVEIRDAEAGIFLTGIYCDEIRGLSIKQFDTRHVSYVQPLEKKAPAESFSLHFPLFQARETDSCYLFTAKDSNRNLAIDPGEAFGFYTNRTDKLPTMINLRDTHGTLMVEASRLMGQGNATSILVKGRLEKTPELRAAMKRFYVIAVKYDEASFSPESIVKNIIGFSQVEGDSETYEIDVTESFIRPGDEITVFALGVQSTQGLPMLDDGDAIGLAIEAQSVTKRRLEAGVNAGFDVKLKQRYFDGRAKVRVAMESDYIGPMMLVGYRGALSLDVNNIDTSNIVGFATLQKSEKKASATVEIYSLGEKWPLRLYVIGVLDANRNQKIDPGELLQLPVGANGQPEALTIQNGETIDYKLTYLYTTQVPSAQNLSISGKLHLNTNVEAPYVHILVAQAEDPNQLLKDPLRYVKAFQRIPSVTRQFTVPLTNTSLRPGDKIQIMAVTSDGSEDFPSLNERTLVGIYTGKTQGYQLTPGSNEELDIVIDRNVYRNVVSILGSFKSPYRGSMITTLYKGDPIDLLNQKFRVSDFVAFSKISKETDQLDIQFQTLLSNQRLPLTALPILVEDSNGNDYPDPGETVHYAIDPKTKNPLLLRLTPSFVTSFTFNQDRRIPTRSLTPLTISGRIRIGQSGAESQIFVLVLDDGLKSMAAEEIAKHTLAAQRISANSPSFSIDLAGVGVKPGDKVMIAALADRDHDGFPQLTTNDILGFYSEGDSFPYTVKQDLNGPFEIDIDRTVFDGKAAVEGTIVGAKGTDLMIVAYHGDIESLTSFEPDPSQILGFTSTDGASFFDLDVNPFGTTFPVQTYIFGIADSNGNQALDPGETLYYFSQRQDLIPEKISLDKGQKVSLILNQRLVMQKPLGHDIHVSGRIAWPKVPASNGTHSYLFVARATSIDDLRNRPLNTIRYLERLDGRPLQYDVSLAETDLKPSDPIFVGVWIDTDHSLSLSAGDSLGVHLHGLSPLSATVSEAGHTGIDIVLNMNLYPTRKTISAAFFGSNYKGPVVAGLLAGTMRSLRLDSIDPSLVASVKTFTKTTENSDFDLDIFPTFPLPLENVTLFALLDANGNGQPDPEEQIGFASLKPNGFPRGLTITQDTAATFSINSYYRIPKPSGKNITVTGRIDNNFGTDGLASPIMIALFRDSPLDKLAATPLTYLKSFALLEPGTSTFELNLAASDLTPGDNVTVLAVQNKGAGSLEQTQIKEGTRLGILLNTQTLSTARPLVEGTQDLTADGYGIVIKRQFYQHDGRFEVKFGGTIPMANGDVIGIGAYRIDSSQPLDQVASIDYDQVIGLYRGSYQSGKVYSVPIFPALVPGIVNSERKIPGVLIVGWKDTNQNGKIEDNEPIGFYSEALVPGIPNLITLALTLNQLSGSITMGGSVQTPGALGATLLNH